MLLADAARLAISLNFLSLPEYSRKKKEKTERTLQLKNRPEFVIRHTASTAVRTIQGVAKEIQLSAIFLQGRIYAGKAKSSGHRAMGCDQKHDTSVAVKLAPVRVPTHQPLVPSFTSVVG